MAEHKQYDVVVVGGGVCGALIADKLAGKGKSVLVLEAGTRESLDPRKYDEFIANMYLIGAPRGTPNGPYPPNLSALSPNDSAQHPYFIQDGKQRFMSDYLRMAGGSTLHWQGTSLRMLPNDFCLQSTYGQSVDWPISYGDLEPHYREAEWAIGIAGNVADQQNFGVWFAPGYEYPMEQMPASYLDAFFEEKLVNVQVNLYGGTYPLRVIHMPMARNSTPRPGYNPAGAVGDMAFKGERCQGNSSCSPLCPVQAKYSAIKTLHHALRAGNVELRTQCVASKLRIDPATGRVAGVEYKRYFVRGQSDHVTEAVEGTIVVMASNAIENSVLGLASGLVDYSGQLGRNLMDHPYLSLHGLAPRPVYPFRGPDLTSGVETLRDGKFREKHASFRASLSNWGWPGEPASSVTRLIEAGIIGKELRRQLEDKLTRMVRLGVFLEQLPNPNNRVTIDPGKTDLLGNYLPIITYSYDDYSLDAALAVLSTVWPAIIKGTGIQDHTDFSTVPGGFQAVTHRGFKFNLMGPGHIVGTHRMGLNKNTSVVDSSLRSWAHPNLYMVGAGSMVTIGTSNPTLTAAALSLRAADSIVNDLN